MDNLLFNKIKGFIQLIRPVNTLICGLSVLCGGIIREKPLDHLYELITCLTTNEIPSWSLRILSAALSASLILAAGNAFNDVRDVSCDRINAPYRPLPSGTVTPQEATVFALLLTLMGIILSMPLGQPGIAVAFTAVILLFVYNMRLKGVPLLGNAVVACLGGLAFLYGGIAGNAVQRALIPAAFAVLYHLGRELIKDAQDMNGDCSAGIRTAATVWGTSMACRLSSIIFIILAAATVIPFVSGYFGTAYGVIIGLGVWPVIIYSVTVSLKYPSEKQLLNVSHMLKVAMPVGIIGVLAGFQGW
ncbi:geranylgeranylglycerol-phosphate geranylgeranyltransferase [Candidatus Latescibacterota bacterium]